MGARKNSSGTKIGLGLDIFIYYVSRRTKQDYAHSCISKLSFILVQSSRTIGSPLRETVNKDSLRLLWLLIPIFHHATSKLIHSIGGKVV